MHIFFPCNIFGAQCMWILFVQKFCCGLKITPPPPPLCQNPQSQMVQPWGKNTRLSSVNSIVCLQFNKSTSSQWHKNHRIMIIYAITRINKAFVRGRAGKRVSLSQESVPDYIKLNWRKEPQPRYQEPFFLLFFYLSTIFMQWLPCYQDDCCLTTITQAKISFQRKH